MKTYNTWEDLRNDQISKRRAIDKLSNLEVIQLALGKVISFIALETVLLIVGVILIALETVLLIVGVILIGFMVVINIGSIEPKISNRCGHLSQFEG